MPRVSSSCRARPDVPTELLWSWRASVPAWFGRHRRPVPGAEEHPHLALVDSTLGALVVKREVPGPSPWKRSLQRLGARTWRSQRAFGLATELQRLGIPTPEALAAWVGDGEAFLVTRFVAGRSPWGYLAGARGGSSLDPPGTSIPSPHPPGDGQDADGCGARLELLAQAIGRALARLHAAGFRHRDLKAPNILVRDADDPPSVLWLDLDGLARRESVSDAVRVRDLARLCASLRSSAARRAGVRRGDWAVFVRAYLTHAGEGRPEVFERTLCDTRRWADRHVLANLIRGRPVV